MITKDELQKLFVSTETYRVERTASTTDKDKFGEAVCAFANDMPDTGKPGYLLIGVRSVKNSARAGKRIRFGRKLPQTKDFINDFGRINNFAELEDGANKY